MWKVSDAGIWTHNLLITSHLQKLLDLDLMSNTNLIAAEKCIMICSKFYVTSTIQSKYNITQKHSYITRKFAYGIGIRAPPPLEMFVRIWHRHP